MSSKAVMNQRHFEDRRLAPKKAKHTLGSGQGERVVRSVAHALGERFRLKGSGLPGRPHLVFPRHRLALFVCDCAHYGHHGATKSWLTPGTRRQAVRDLVSFVNVLGFRGWRADVIWACQTVDTDALQARLTKLFEPAPEPSAAERSRLGPHELGLASPDDEVKHADDITGQHGDVREIHDGGIDGPPHAR